MQAWKRRERHRWRIQSSGAILLSLSLAGCLERDPDFIDPVSAPTGSTSSTSAGTTSAAGDTGDDAPQSADLPDTDTGGPMGGDTTTGGGGPTCDWDDIQACDGACVDPNSDPMHCGDCDQPCSGTSVCQQGNCRTKCTGQFTTCGRACVRLQDNVLHCGACDTPCLEGQTCVSGSCT